MLISTIKTHTHTHTHTCIDYSEPISRHIKKENKKFCNKRLPSQNFLPKEKKCPKYSASHPGLQSLPLWHSVSYIPGPDDSHEYLSETGMTRLYDTIYPDVSGNAQELMHVLYSSVLTD